MRLMDKISQFEKLTGTVAQFNEIFVNAQLKEFKDDVEVEIGELADSDTTRMLTIGSLIVKHNFSPDKIVEVAENGEYLTPTSKPGNFREVKKSKWSR